MEVQNAVATMVEDDSIELLVGTQVCLARARVCVRLTWWWLTLAPLCRVCRVQGPAMTQQVLSQVTGLPQNRITVTTRRSGGGFGGKFTRGSCVNAAAAVGALLTGRQVHVRLDRVQDMVMVRKRCCGYSRSCRRRGRRSSSSSCCWAAVVETLPWWCWVTRLAVARR
jgi:hypothetical protein